ncbi:MAG: Na+/H+ antiporter NhaA [Bacteroidota bacterium]|jgi:NhaA family Na+:H+ antiporter
MKLRKAFRLFFNSQKATGIILILCTAVSIGLSNAVGFSGYAGFWHCGFSTGLEALHLPDSPVEVINDFLMALFFLLAGLEIKREVLSGELSSLQRASLPVAAAAGGMVVPALIYSIFNHGTPQESGWGIPMATDIAFAIGILSLLGNRVPDSLKLLLTAIAVADDLGAVLVIALFYTDTLAVGPLLFAGGILCLLYLMNRRKVKRLWPYLLGGMGLWYTVHLSGIHATVAGVLLAMMIPYDASTASDPLERLETGLHLPVNRFILPLFALANTAIVLADDSLGALTNSAGIGIMTGLVIGKPLGILLAIFISVKAGFSRLLEGIGYRELLGAGLLGGIGFTMSIFIALLAFDDPALTEPAKAAILAGSALSGVAGYLYLNKILPPSANQLR